MNLIINKLVHGLGLIKRSAQLAFAHPILFVYGAVILTTGIGFMIRFNTVPWFNVVYFFLLAIIDFFALACLCHHAMHILQQELHGFKDTLVDIAMMAGKLFLWFIVQFVLALLVSISTTVMKEQQFSGLSVGALLLLLCVTVINFYTALVFPILAIEENTGIITAIKRSYTIVMAYAMIFLSIFITFFIASTISLYLLPGFAEIVEYFRLLTYTVFYYEYYARPRPELASAFYPDE